MGIAQIALDPLLCQTGKRGKKVPPPPQRAMPLWKQPISKRGFPIRNPKALMI